MLFSLITIAIHKSTLRDDAEEGRHHEMSHDTDIDKHHHKNIAGNAVSKIFLKYYFL